MKKVTPESIMVEALFSVTALKISEIQEKIKKQSEQIIQQVQIIETKANFIDDKNNLKKILKRLASCAIV